MARVLLKDIEKRYDDVQVVRKLNLDVADGEFLVLVGASGCGKSTTLRMVAGLETISSGELQIGERVVNDLSPRDRDIAMVFQSYALYPHMTVRDNMAFGLTLRKMPAAEIAKRVGEAAQLLGLEPLLDRKPAALSGGQRQRVAMGRAVVREPAVFLFDEPLSNLDAKLRVQMRLEIARLHKRLQTTILYVTHDQVEAMTLADRIAVMHGGFLQQCDTPQAIYLRPVNTYVATFIGSPAMNLFPVRAEQQGDQVVVQGSGIRLTLDGRAAQVLAKIEQGQSTVGCRPQDLQVVAPELADAWLHVEVVEPLGAETFVFGALQGHDPSQTWVRDSATQTRLESALIVRLDAATTVRTGDALPVRLRRDQLHVFDAQGQRIGELDGAC